MDLNQVARDETIRYHESYYSSHKLFEEGWLQKPDEEINRVVSCLSGTANSRVLDIGCGVGRNAIAVAKELKLNGVVVDCYDVLDSAIALLHEYASQFQVRENIAGKCIDMDSIKIEPEYYDAILAVSVLEHSGSIEGVARLLNEIVCGTKPGGANRLTISTSRHVVACDSGEVIDTCVETPMSTEQVATMLEERYQGWLIDRLSLVPYKEDLEYNGRLVTWSCTDVSFFARRPV
jgi:2-polyprenyl-3-methyl-5-hydroxy-6-metoxy-1,4-benzoquinol methylase